MKKNSPNLGAPWTDRAHAFLRKHYATMPLDELARRLRRTPTAVKSRAGVLGLSKGRKYWTADEIALLRRLYPRTPGPGLAARFGVSPNRLYAMASRLGLRQDADFRLAQARAAGRLGAQHPNAIAHRIKPGTAPPNKGRRRPGYAPGRMAETQFKKGQRRHNTLPVGTVKFNADGYLVRKIADIPHNGVGALSKNWEFVHKRVWEDAHGPIPKGYRIWWKDGDRSNCALENLELLSGKEHMARTTIHNLPKPLKEVVQLKSAIRRAITMKTKKEEAAAV